MMRAALVGLVASGANAFTLPDTWKDSKFKPHLETANYPDAAKFPGATQKETDEAFPLGAQPKNMEAWPRTADGVPEACWQITVLQDTTSGWANSCLGLTKSEGIKDAVACKAACRENALCPSWQYNPTTGCFLGDGKTCDASRPPLEGESGERIQHGAVSVLLDTRAPAGDESKAFEVMNLIHMGRFHQEDGDLPSIELGATRCKDLCYSDLRCRYFQYSKVDGCWFDNGEIASLDEFTTADIKKPEGNVWLQDFVAGEYIQHYCPEEVEGVAPAPEKEVAAKDEADKTWLWVLLGLVGLLLILAAVAAYICSKKEAPKKKRAIKVKAPEPEPVVPLMAVQTVMPTVQTYAAPMTTYAAPMTTYAAPQMGYAPQYAAPQQVVYR